MILLSICIQPLLQLTFRRSHSGNIFLQSKFFHQSNHQLHLFFCKIFFIYFFINQCFNINMGKEDKLFEHEIQQQHLFLRFLTELHEFFCKHLRRNYVSCLFVRGGWGNDRGRVTLGRGKTATKKLAEDAIKLIKNVASKKVSLSLF